MGRCRVFAEQKVLLVDTASDLFFGKTGRESPLDGLSPVHVRRFEVALLGTAPRGWRVFVLNAGMALRVPGVTAQRLAILLDRQASQAPGVIREIGLTPPPSGETT
jgi:hypothetical protein